MRPLIRIVYYWFGGFASAADSFPFRQAQRPNITECSPPEYDTVVKQNYEGEIWSRSCTSKTSIRVRNSIPNELIA